MRGFFGVVALLLCAASAVAGALAPCIQAASSASGNFLVITDVEFSHPLPAPAEHVTVQIVPREMFTADTIHKVTSPNTYWIRGGANGWSVEIERSDSFFSPCPIPIISDDGEFLILLQSMTPIFDPAMRIYRRAKEGYKGTFVKDISLKDIWPENRWEELRFEVMTDESSEWFAEGASFAFSSDSLTLIHKTRWGNTVRIALANGVVSKQ